TEGEAVLPPAPDTFALARAAAVTSEGDGPSLSIDHGSGTVGSQVQVSGEGFPAGAAVDLTWSTVTGNRISGAGWQEVERVLESVEADASGAFSTKFETPDDLGGGHTLRAVAGAA